MSHSQIEKPQFELPSTVGDTSKVWIYQSTRPLNETEVQSIGQECAAFVAKWAAHGTRLTADYAIFYKQFICLFVDESAHGASGCSIDSSVHFMQSLERKFGLELFTRTEVAYFDDQHDVVTIHMNDMADAQKLGKISSDTLVFNNLVTTKGEMKTNWIVPITESWHARLLS
jgi:hypothetical protein